MSKKSFFFPTVRRYSYSSVLLFPPVNNFRRFLIHQTCENFRQKYELFTFSVGQGPYRRTVVCFKSQLLDPQKFENTTAATPFDRRNQPIHSQLKNWRTDKPLQNSCYTAVGKPKGTTNNIKSDRKMGAEKNVIDTKLNKSSSLDIYQPPALRTNSIDETKNNGAEPCEIFTSSPTTALTNTTSISCNNSPIHRNEYAISIADKTTSPQYNSLYSIKQQKLELAELPKQQRQRQQHARRERRPDRAVYIPRARRSQTTPPTTSQIQQPPSLSIPVPPPANAITVTASTTTASYTTNCMNQQLPIISNESTVLVNGKPSCKADEIGKASNDGNAIISTTKKREKLSKESREHRELRDSKKTTCTDLKYNAKNETKSTENKINDVVLKSITVIDKETPVLQSSNFDLDCTNCIESSPKVFKCDSDCVEKLNEVKSDQLGQEPYIQQNYFNFNQDDKCAGNEFETNILHGTIDTICVNSPNILNSAVASPSENVFTMPKSSNKAKADINAKLPNLRIEEVASQPKCDIEEQELQRASKEINRSNRRIIKQTFVSDILQIPDHIIENEPEAQINEAHATLRTVDSNTEEEDEDDWETMFDESGECLDPKIIQELTAAVGKCKIELPKMDYSAFLTKQSILNEEEFPHVLEVSNFPVEFKNQDLLMIFSQYKESGFDIKWVDDTHALAVFSSSRIAAEVLTMGHPFVVLKPLAEATLESRLKAKKCAASLQPYRPRPETCAALARRLVTGALGVRLKTAAAERENEKRVLREAKERKLLAAKQRDDAWDS